MFNYDKGITPRDELLHLVSDPCDVAGVETALLRPVCDPARVRAGPRS